MRAADAFVQAGRCPACRRYIGQARVCPYCDVDIPLPLRLRLTRISAFMAASGGLLLLRLATTGMNGNMLPDLPLRFYTVIKPHLHWMLWCGIAYGLLTIPPDPVPPGLPRWLRLLSANRSLAVITTIILLTGLLGFVLRYAGPR